MAIRGSGFTLSNEGTNIIRVPFSTRRSGFELIKSESVTSGGYLRGQTAGCRLVVTESNVRMTQLQYKALMAYILDSANRYRYYESDDRPDYIPTTDWPLSVMINVVKDRQLGGGPVDGIVYFLTIEMKSIRLFTSEDIPV